MLNFREKIFVFSLVSIIVVSLFLWGKIVYFALTNEIPKSGGEYVEGIVGQPRFINPLISNTTFADSDLVSLIYSGLFKYDTEGLIEKDLAENYEVSEDGKSYTIYLKKGVKWHDGEDLTADDVVFTFNLIRDPEYKSFLRTGLQGVSISKMDDHTVKFDLSNPYFRFLESLAFGILPKHVWEETPADKFALVEGNLKPVGSGPYKFLDIQKKSNGDIVSYKLSSFKEYYMGDPYISKMIFNFYPDEDALIADFNKKEVSGMGNVSVDKLSNLKASRNVEIKDLVTPRYFALFANQSTSKPLSYDEVRRALSIGTDRQKIVDEILHGRGFPIYSPIFPQMQGYVDASSDYTYDIEKAKSILDEAGWKLDETEGVRKKGDTRLEFEIVTIDWPQIVESAEFLRSNWESLGVKIKDIKVLSAGDFQQNYVKTREYESVLFGQDLSFVPDLYSYFHSENKRDPGLNLSLFENKDLDELISSVRQENDEAKRIEKYHKMIEIIKEKNPAIFLYSQYYIYPISKSVKGVKVKNIVSPSSRFSDVNEWYIKTKRVWK